MTDGSSDESGPREQTAEGDRDVEDVGTPLGDQSGVYIPQDSAPSEADEDETDAPIDFGGFLVSLGTSCMVNLGHVENPETGEENPVNLPAAKQTIEILKLLKEKTRGNLDTDEQKLLESLLHDTQLAYEETKQEHVDPTD